MQSIEVGMRLVRALATANTPQMLRDLSAAARMPPAKAHRYLVSLTRAGLVEQHAASGLYDLGKFAMDLGLNAVGRLQPMSAAEPLLEPLCRQINNTVALAVWANQGATIVRWVGADTPVAATLRVGSVMPLTRSATGLAFLAFLSAAATAVLLERELAENRRRGLVPDRRAALRGDLQAIRRRGYAYADGFIPGIAGMAAPIIDHTGTMVLALVALGYAQPFATRRDPIAGSVLEAAKALSARLGAHATRPSPGA